MFPFLIPEDKAEKESVAVQSTKEEPMDYKKRGMTEDNEEEYLQREWKGFRPDSLYSRSKSREIKYVEVWRSQCEGAIRIIESEIGLGWKAP